MQHNSSFHDVAFPTDIAFGVQRSVLRPSEIVTLGSGHEQRNQRWQHSRRRFDAGFGIRTMQELQDVVAFYEARRGPYYAFRFHDPFDFKSCAATAKISFSDQVIGIGDGTRNTFQLSKSYGLNDQAYLREIQLPVVGSVLVGVEESLRTDATCNPLNGLIIFPENAVPQLGEKVTAGFHFDVPVRFSEPELTVNLAAFDSGDIPDIPLIEVLL